MCLPFFFFNDTATTEIYTLSLHDALPISGSKLRQESTATAANACGGGERGGLYGFRSGQCHDGDRRQPELRLNRRLVSDRKSTRLNSSHSQISYAVFCLKKKIQQSPRLQR